MKEFAKSTNQTDRQTDRQADRQTDRHTDRHTDSRLVGLQLPNLKYLDQFSQGRVLLSSKIGLVRMTLSRWRPIKGNMVCQFFRNAVTL